MDYKRRRLADRDEHGNKFCSGCKDWLPEGQFGSNAALPDGLANHCKDCQWSAGLWNKYRIRGEDYLALLDRQGGVCAICSRVNENGRALAVDHDHSCCPGARSCGSCIRGLLCISCNAALGNLRDDESLLVKAIEYLRSYRD